MNIGPVELIVGVAYLAVPLVTLALLVGVRREVRRLRRAVEQQARERGVVWGPPPPPWQ